MPQGKIQRRLQVFATSPSDPNFALGYRIVGGDYNALGQLGRRHRSTSTRAFQLRDHFNEREKLVDYRRLLSQCHRRTGQSGLQPYQEQIGVIHPREPGPYNNQGA